MRILDIVRAASATAPAALLALTLSGCGGSSGEAAGPAPIPVVNPDPNDPYKGITLENEAQNLNRLPPNMVPRKK